MGRRKGDWQCKYVLSNGNICNKVNGFMINECERCYRKKEEKRAEE